MAGPFTVQDLRTDQPREHSVQRASGPEEAAMFALGLKLVRGSPDTKVLIAKIYWPNRDGGRTMVRLYAPPATPDEKL